LSFVFLHTLFLGCSTENSSDQTPTFPQSNATSLSAAHHLLGKASFDWSGHAVVGNGDVDADGLADFLIGAPGNDEGETAAGQIYLILGKTLNEEEISLQENIIFTGERYSAGSSLGFLPDLDNDSMDEIVIGEPLNKRVYIFKSQSIMTSSLQDADCIIEGAEAGDYMGWSIASAGDVDGDNKGDLIIGADGRDHILDTTGTAYLLRGRDLDESGLIYINEISTSLMGTSQGEKAGVSVASAGDVDGDGLDDLLIGAKGNQEMGPEVGAAYLVLAQDINFYDPTELPQIGYQFLGENPLDEAGSAVAGVGDINADGRDDFLIGAPSSVYNHQGMGTVYGIFGEAMSSQQYLLSNAPIVIEGLFPQDHTGHAVSAAGDIDQDGFMDISISSPSLYFHNHGGAVYVIKGSQIHQGGSFSVQDADFVFKGENGGDMLGFSLGFAGDVYGNGSQALLIGAPAYDGSGEDRGQSYLITNFSD